MMISVPLLFTWLNMVLARSRVPMNHAVPDCGPSPLNRQAKQTAGLLVTRELEEAKLKTFSSAHNGPERELIIITPKTQSNNYLLLYSPSVIFSV